MPPATTTSDLTVSTVDAPSATFSLKKRGMARRCLEIILKNSHRGKLPPNIDLVADIPNVEPFFRSGLPRPQHIENLKNLLGVESILTLASDELPVFDVIKNLRIKHKFLKCNKATMTIADIRIAIAWLQKSERALVHCHSGADKTGILVAALRAQQGEKNRGILLREMLSYFALPQIVGGTRRLVDELLPAFL